MEYSSLYDLITCLEYGTNVHISVVFLDDYGNFKTNLPFEKTIHSKPFCRDKKTTQKGFYRCIKCRNIALRKAVKSKMAFGGLCINGVYEYCSPVLQNDTVIAVIFIGNILSDKTKCTDKQKDTLEKDFPYEKCIQFASIVETHIRLLINEYRNTKTEYDPLITNIMNYIEEGMFYDVSVSNIATAFNYSTKYIGKIFKKRTGMTVTEYMNFKRLKKAKELLKNTDMPVTEISQNCGFNNVTYFNRLFKFRYSITPTGYRNS